MCGIVGLIDYRNAVDPLVIANSADIFCKRGPDDSGVWVEQNAGLGHRRLSIIDTTAAGHQPMVSADGRYVIVFNGEIYNYAELRRELEADESRWQSNSDAEVILAAYAKWGPDCLSRFHGMFAFAIWDRREARIFAARDRMGVKPFYYHHSASCFAFASRPRALFSLHSDISPAIDEQALHYYLQAGYVPAPYSIHRDIRKLPPAHYLLLDGKDLAVKRYWDFRTISPVTAWEKRSEGDLLDELDEIVSRCVKYRLVSDVPLGAFLSGGVDSSLVVAMMKKYSSAPVKTFTIGFDEKKYDESVYAAAVSNHLNTEHHSESLKVDDLLTLLPTFQEEFDEPFSDSSAFPTLAVSRLTRRFVKVSLSGDGGDELFGGYHYYRIIKYLSCLFKFPGEIRQFMSRVAGILPGHQFKLLSAAMRQPDAISAFAFSRSIAKDFGAVLLPDALARTDSLHNLFLDTAQTFPAGLSVAEQAMRLDASFTLPDDYLQKVDLASMAFSLESREPLLDQHLVEWAMKLPVTWKLRGGINKYLLRKLACRYIPENLLNRPKQGFEVPIDGWVRGPLKSWAADKLNNKDLFSRIPLDQSKVLGLFELHNSGARNVYPLLWAVLMLLDFCSGKSRLVNLT